MSWTMSWSKVVLCLFVSVLLFDSVRTVHSRHNRAGRHRRVPDPGPEPVVQVFGEVQEQQQNKHKPVFENCENYQPTVNEEASRGRTFFIDFCCTLWLAKFTKVYCGDPNTGHSNNGTIQITV